jgi:hypothetical protein
MQNLEKAMRPRLRPKHVLLSLFVFGAIAPQRTFAQAFPDDPTHEVIHSENTDPPPYDLSHFKVPSLSQSEQQAILRKYANFDPHHLVPTSLLQSALFYFEVNNAYIPNKKFLTIVNFSAFSGANRFYVVEMATGSVFAAHVAHGTGSDPVASGYTRIQSNIQGSNSSSAGFFLVSEKYKGDNGPSIRLDGLSITNSNVRLRDIVIHSASYVDDTSSKASGRSWGCFALSAKTKARIYDQISGGSLLYADRSAGGTDEYLSVWPGRWEAKVPEGRNWTIFTYDIVDQYGPHLITGSQDMTKFCPNYQNINRIQKISFWVTLMSALSDATSVFNKTLRVDAGAKDSVTGQEKFWEGLLQVAYQDKTDHGCAELNWTTDKKLAVTDPTKTTFDPVANLMCGVRVLNDQVAKAGQIVSANNHWAALDPNAKTNRIAALQQITNQISFCH